MCGFPIKGGYRCVAIVSKGCWLFDRSETGNLSSRRNRGRGGGARKSERKKGGLGKGRKQTPSV